MRGWELHEALKWTARHRDQLLPEDSSAFEFQLHTLLYLRTLTEKGALTICSRSEHSSSQTRSQH